MRINYAVILGSSGIHRFRFMVIDRGIIMYIVNKLFKLSEEDSYRDGCLPESASNSIIDITFTNNTLTGLLEELKSFTGCDDILLNSCDEVGRVDLQGYETLKGDKATDNDYTLWKTADKRLLHVTYTAYAYKAELSTLIEGF